MGDMSEMKKIILKSSKCYAGNGTGDVESTWGMGLDFSEWSGKASLCRDPEDETNAAMGISGAECSSRENIKCKAP